MDLKQRAGFQFNLILQLAPFAIWELFGSLFFRVPLFSGLKIFGQCYQILIIHCNCNLMSEDHRNPAFPPWNCCLGSFIAAFLSHFHFIEGKISQLMATKDHCISLCDCVFLTFAVWSILFVKFCWSSYSTVVGYYSGIPLIARPSKIIIHTFVISLQSESNSVISWSLTAAFLYNCWPAARCKVRNLFSNAYD